MPWNNTARQRAAAAKICQERTVHGHGRRGAQSPTWYSYHSMLTRCTNPNRSNFHNYGGRGIAVCERWSGPGGFEIFLADMGERPEGTTLERRDRNGNYEPGNCRWATRAEQGQNTARTVVTAEMAVEIRMRHAEGESYTTLARSLGISKPTVGDIVRRRTWTNV